MKRLALVLLALASCDGSGSDIETQEVALGPIAFQVPNDWQRTNTEASGTLSAMWTPAADINERKESVTVIRSPLRRTREQLVRGDLAKLLAGAQGSLHGARVSQVTPVSTRRGLTGARIDVSFQPEGIPTRYRRVHVVLVDAETSGLVHVLYTAARPDAELTALDAVLASLHGEEG